jgi:UDP-N-acetylglucosamine/UDP-N-acetylgalactosamine diphosphorylase
MYKLINTKQQATWDFLKELGEGHVFTHATGAMEVHQICKQLEGIDMKRQKDLYEKVILATEKKSRFDGANIDSVESLSRLVDTPQEQQASWQRTTYDAIGSGKLALLILAGGAGTRLGFNGPKGKFRVGSPSNASLFELHSHRVRKLEIVVSKLKGVDVRIPIYIMTSPTNNDETVKFFRENDFFDLDPKNVQFFAQGTLPCFNNDDGKLMMDSPNHIAVAADGNGGLYPAMYNTGILDDLTNRGVEYVHTICIDNILVKALDPAFMGLIVQSKAEVGSLVVKKREWKEPIGMLVLLNGKYAIAEYSDVRDDMKQERTIGGRLKFESGNICIHAFSTKFLAEKVVPEYVKKIVPENYHIAKKTIPVWDADTQKVVQPNEKNGIKLEMFIFDVFKFAESMVILQVPREEQFSPVKNSTGIDSPESARQMMSNLHRTWLVTAGATIIGNGLIEISPLVSYNGEGLEEFNGKTINTPCLLLPRFPADPEVIQVKI